MRQKSMMILVLSKTTYDDYLKLPLKEILIQMNRLSVLFRMLQMITILNTMPLNYWLKMMPFRKYIPYWNPMIQKVAINTLTLRVIQVLPFL